MDDYIVTDNPARVIEAFVNTLDMKELGSHKAEPKNIGKPPYESICYFVVYQGHFHTVCRPLVTYKLAAQ